MSISIHMGSTEQSLARQCSLQELSTAPLKDGPRLRSDLPSHYRQNGRAQNTIDLQSLQALVYSRCNRAPADPSRVWLLSDGSLEQSVTVRSDMVTD
jgi:hypothetical protein